MALLASRPVLSVLGSRRWATSFFRRGTPTPSPSRDLTPIPQPSPSSSAADAVLPPLRTATRGVDLRAAVTESEGLTSPVLILRLQPNDSIRASPSSLLYQTPSITVQGEGLVVDFVNTGGGQEQVALSPEYLSDLEVVDLREHSGNLTVQRGALLCCHSSVQISDEVSRAPSAEAFLGGGGFSPQRLTGEGSVVLKGGGGFYVDELLDGQTIKVTPAALVACESTVSYSPSPLSPSGPSLLMLTGPGRGVAADHPPRSISAVVPRCRQRRPRPLQGSTGPAHWAPLLWGAWEAPLEEEGGMMSGLGGAMATGAAMGVGSELVHRAFGGHGGGGSSAAPPADAGAGAAAPGGFGGVGDQGAQGGVEEQGGYDQGGYGQGEAEGMRNDLPPEDNSGGGDGGWFGGMFGGDNDQGDDDGGDWSGDE